jgi:chromatin remodeling complex protein RSC6
MTEATTQTAINKVVNFTPGFSSLFGIAQGTRAEAVKAVWAYATKNGLKSQKELPTKKDPSKLTKSAVILPNPGLSTVFGQAEYYDLGGIARGVSANVLKA